MFAAKIEHLLRLGDSTNGRTGKTASAHDQAKRRHIERLCRSTDERKIPVDAEQIEIRVDIVIGGNGVENEIKTAGVFLHFVSVARDDSFIGAEAKGIMGALVAVPVAAVLQVVFDRFYRFPDTGKIILLETSDPLPAPEPKPEDAPAPVPAAE